MILRGRRHDGKDVTDRCSTIWSPVDGFFLLNLFRFVCPD